MQSVYRRLNLGGAAALQNQSPLPLSIVFFGRSPFSQPRNQFFAQHDLLLQQNDLNRVDFDDLSSEETQQYATLRNHLEGYLHANTGLFSGPLDFSVYTFEHGERLILCTDTPSQSKNEKQRISTVLTASQENELHIEANVNLMCMQHFSMAHRLSAEEMQIINKLLTSSHLGRDALVTTTFTYRYAEAQTESVLNDDCDLRRRLFSFSLQENIDDTRLFSYITLAEANVNIETRWDEYLAQPFESENHDKHLIIEANRVDFSSNYLQNASVTRRQIQAMIVCELKLLQYFKARLQVRSSFWNAKPNKIGLCTTLLRYNENLLIPSENSAIAIDFIRQALKNIDELDVFCLQETINDLIVIFKSQEKSAREYFEKSFSYAPIAVWENVKMVLRETGLVSHLTVYARYFLTDMTLHEVLKRYEADLASDSLFETLQKNGHRVSCELISSIFLPLKKLHAACKKLQPNDLDSFFNYSVNNFMNLIIEVQKKVSQLKSLNVILEVLKQFEMLFPEKLDLITNIKIVIHRLSNPHEVQVETLENTLRIKIQDELLAEELYQLVAGLQAAQCYLCGNHLDLYIVDFLIGTQKMRPFLPHHSLYQDDNAHYQNLDDIYRACCSVKHFCSVFDAMTDKFLENIRESCGNMRDVSYNEALILRHYLLMLAPEKNVQELEYNGENEFNFFYGRWGKDLAWVNAFLNVASEDQKVGLAIVALGKHINHRWRKGEVASDYIEKFETLLQAEALFFLNEEGKAILEASAWMALLVHRYQFPLEGVQIVLEKITTMLGQVKNAFPVVINAWEKFLVFEKTRARTRCELRVSIPLFSTPTKNAGNRTQLTPKSKSPFCVSPMRKAAQLPRIARTHKKVPDLSEQTQENKVIVKKTRWPFWPTKKSNTTNTAFYAEPKSIK